jgi:hypothetical protein
MENDENNKTIEVKQERAMTPVEDHGPLAMLLDSGKFAQAWRASQLLSTSTLLPAHFSGKPQNVFVALQLAQRMDLDPFMAMQRMYVVSGRPGFEAQFILALINSRGPFKGPIQWRMEGKEGTDTRRAIAYATRKTGELCEAECSIMMARAEGWLDKNGSKWRTMPELMLRYRSASIFARLHCPEVTMGFPSSDELIDSAPIEDAVPLVPRAAPSVELVETPEPPKPTQTAQLLDLLGANNP